MSASIEASDLIKRLCEPAPVGAHIESLIRTAARKAGLSFSRGKAIWYREARVIRAEELDVLRRAAGKAVRGPGNAGLQARIERMERLSVEMADELHQLRASLAGRHSA